jgi:hypothetical protein
MKSIFEQGVFNNYRSINLENARLPITESFQFGQAVTTVFISHRHTDLDDLKGVIGFLEQNYGVKVYIDSKDTSMPEITNGETANKLKTRISMCNKFILLATDGAIESKWCNWELGYGDAKKYEKNIALFPLKPKGNDDSKYKGNEYLSIYPSISYYDGYEKYDNGNFVTSGYYVRTIKNGTNLITPLTDWLKQR